MTPGMQQQFVAGATSEYDQRIVALLRKTDTHATIFLTGLWAQDHPDVVRSLASDPLFQLGNHTFDHAAFRTPCYGLVGLTTDQERQTEVTRSADILTHLTGQAPAYFRFPGGCHTAADVTMVRALGEIPVQWDVVSGDAFQADAAVIVHDVLGRVRSGSIVVMHLMGAPNAPATYDALERIIPALATRGFRIVSLTALLGGGKRGADSPLRPG